MSGSFEKRADGASRRQARVEKELKAKRKTKIIAISVVSVLVVLFACALFINSKYARRILPAITIGNIDFSAAEFDYFYRNAYYEYRELVNSQMGEYASSMLPPNEMPPFAHLINSMTGEPWSETFIEYAIARMSDIVQLYTAAIAAGHTMSPEARAGMDEEIEMFRMGAAAYGIASFDSYLQMFFGPNMNESLFRRVSEMVTLAGDYDSSVRSTFTFTPAQLTAYYSENRDTLDNFTFRYFMVTAEYVDQDEYATTEEYDAALEAALDVAREEAWDIVAGIGSEEDFIEAAIAYDEDLYSDPESTLREYPGSWLGTIYGPWLVEAGREEGDVTAADATTGSYVIQFIHRDANEYLMPSMHQILILRQDIDPDYYALGEDDPDYLSDLEVMEEEAFERAQTALGLFTGSGIFDSAPGSKERLLEVMADHSDDTTEDGFYEQISKDASHRKMITEIEEWLFDESRVVGDYALIRTEAYGYHLVYFAGHGERYCDYVAENNLRDEAYTNWKEQLEPVEEVRRWAFVLTYL